MHSSFFFVAPTDYDTKVVKKKWKENTSQIISEFKDELSKLDTFSYDLIKNAVNKFVEKKEIGMGQVMTALRLLMVGGSMGPDLVAILELLGKKEVIKRIEIGLEKIKK